MKGRGSARKSGVTDMAEQSEWGVRWYWWIHLGSENEQGQAGSELPVIMCCTGLGGWRMRQEAPRAKCRHRISGCLHWMCAPQQAWLHPMNVAATAAAAAAVAAAAAAAAAAGASLWAGHRLGNCDQKVIGLREREDRKQSAVPQNYIEMWTWLQPTRSTEVDALHTNLLVHGMQVRKAQPQRTIDSATAANPTTHLLTHGAKGF